MGLNRPEFALHKIQPILTPEQFAVNHIAGRTEHTRVNRLLGVGFVTLLNGLAVGLLQPLGRQAAFGEQFGQHLLIGNMALLCPHRTENGTADFHGRINAVVQNLRLVGVSAEELPDGLIVRRVAREFSGVIDPRADHRIAMAFGILSAATGNKITVRNPECVAVSYPKFWEDLRRVVA